MAKHRAGFTPPKHSVTSFFWGNPYRPTPRTTVAHGLGGSYLGKHRAARGYAATTLGGSASGRSFFNRRG